MNPKNSLWWRNKPINLQEIRRQLHENLIKGGIDAPENTSLLLLSQAIDQPKSWVLAHGEYELTLEENCTLQKNLIELLQSTPLPYVLGAWEFYGRRFKITPNVLIPRPETEILVQKAIECAKNTSKPKIIDVGTGSGIIAVSLAAELSSAVIFAADISHAALKIAEQNAHKHAQTQIHFVQSNLLEPISVQFDLICANLPYIPTKKLQSLDIAKYEPSLSLDGGESGMRLIHQLLNQAQTRLASGGTILLEIESSLGKETLALARSAFPEAQHRLHQDLAGLDRVIEIHQV
jgi:release factor glutamine methyltransferase